MMKTIYKLNIYLVLVLAMFFSCRNNSQQDGDQGSNGSKNQTFSSVNEAATKAKNDLIEVMRTNKDFNLGVDAGALANAQPGNPVRQVELDFNRILRSENVTDLEQLVKGQKNIVVPLVSNNNVVTIIELQQADNNYSIAGLAGREISEDLNNIYRVSESAGLKQNITIYEVPNLNAKVYGVKSDTVNIYYTNYGGKFSIRQGVNARELLSVIREDAISFERQYGDIIRKQNLLK